MFEIFVVKQLLDEQLHNLWGFSKEKIITSPIIFFNGKRLFIFRDDFPDKYSFILSF